MYLKRGTLLPTAYCPLTARYIHPEPSPSPRPSPSPTQTDSQETAIGWCFLNLLPSRSPRELHQPSPRRRQLPNSTPPVWPLDSCYRPDDPRCTLCPRSERPSPNPSEPIPGDRLRWARASPLTSPRLPCRRDRYRPQNSRANRQRIIER